MGAGGRQVQFRASCTDPVGSVEGSTLVLRSPGACCPRRPMDSKSQAVHGGAFSSREAAPSGAAAATSSDTPVRRRRERSVSSDASDSYIEQLLRPDLRRAHSESEKPAASSVNTERPPVSGLTGDGARTAHVCEASDTRRRSPEEGGVEEADAGPIPETAAPDERMCRICFDGPDEELGKLFSPCLCRGTVSSAFCSLVSIRAAQGSAAGRR